MSKKKPKTVKRAARSLEACDLATACGGVANTAAVARALTDQGFVPQGAQLNLPPAHFGAPKNGVEKVSGKYDVLQQVPNQDDVMHSYSFTGRYNVSTQTVSGLRTKLLSQS
jgi:hypothetical protein